jgi:hypothetical protein
LLLGALVGGSMLIITGLYAFSMRYQDAFRQPTADFPRWTALTDGLLQRTDPIRAQIDRLKGAVSVVAGASRTRNEAAALLKAKLESRAASSTPETAAPHGNAAKTATPEPL